MPGVKTLSDLIPTFTKMGSAAQKAAAAAVRASTERLAKFVDAAGSRHHVKGRDGKKIPLSAKVDVRGFNNSANKVVWTGAVRGVPEGFWHIVTYGSGPHLITQRGQRKTRSGRTVTTRAGSAKSLRLYSEGHTFGDLRPLGNASSGFGPYPYVKHPGHGPQGNPWAEAMTIGAPVIAETVALEQARALTKAFVQSI